MADGKDRNTKVMLYDGASVSQLAVLFGMDNRTVAGKIADCPSSGRRQGHPVYRIRDAAPYLCVPHGDIEEHIKKMNHRDLPPMLLKEFWTGQQARQKFLESEGDLWRTDAVIDILAETFKTLRMSILLMRDQVERETELSERQRDVSLALTDGLLNDINESLIERFRHEPKRSLQPDVTREPPTDAEDPEYINSRADEL